ncbi:MAG: hypothetical protein KGZ53_10765 [Peptococcaceae bacterium]|nr:hypothetical protein [Peptococcaceae bacterium]
MSAPNAPFFMHFKFAAPSPIVKKKNAAHIKYIGMRPRVDKDEEKHHPPEVNHAIHAQYLHGRPRSHGLFTQEPGEPDMTSVMQEVREHNGIVWRAILSLREDDAIKYGYTDRTSWEVTLRATLPDLAHKLGIKSADLKWFGAFHKEEGHPHVHLVFWDKGLQRERGSLSPYELRYARRLFMREIYGHERRLLMAEKTAIRDATRKSVLEETKNLFKVPRQERITLQNALLQLSFKLPQKGKIYLGFMPEEVKEEARRVADWVLSRTSFASSLARYEAIAEQLTRHHTTQHVQIKEAKQKATEDLRDRIAQVILKASASTRQAHRDRRRTVRSALFLFPRIGLLFGRERRRLEVEAAQEFIEPRPKHEDQEQVEVDKQKEVERA